MIGKSPSPPVPKGGSQGLPSFSAIWAGYDMKGFVSLIKFHYISGHHLNDLDIERRLR